MHIIVNNSRAFADYSNSLIKDSPHKLNILPETKDRINLIFSQKLKTEICFIMQGISLKSSEMQDTARSFSSMAKEVLRFAENDKRS